MSQKGKRSPSPRVTTTDEQVRTQTVLFATSHLMCECSMCSKCTVGSQPLSFLPTVGVTGSQREGSKSCYNI